MTFWDLAFALFLLERPHRHLLLARAAVEPARRRAAGTAFAVGYLEAVALYVAHGPTLWAAVFWAQVVHVAYAARRRLLRRLSRNIATVAAVATIVVAAIAAVASGADAWTFLGKSEIGAASDPAFSTPLVALLALWVLVHSIPKTLDVLKGERPAIVAAKLVFAFGATLLEWYVIAKATGFPGALVFPDLSDWSFVGTAGGLFVVPVWVGFFAASIAADVADAKPALSLKPAPA
jgi:hypothetical protein